MIRSAHKYPNNTNYTQENTNPDVPMAAETSFEAESLQEIKGIHRYFKQIHQGIVKLANENTSRNLSQPQEANSLHLS